MEPISLNEEYNLNKNSIKILNCFINWYKIKIIWNGCFFKKNLLILIYKKMGAVWKS